MALLQPKTETWCVEELTNIIKQNRIKLPICQRKKKKNGNYTQVKINQISMII